MSASLPRDEHGMAYEAEREVSLGRHVARKPEHHRLIRGNLNPTSKQTMAFFEWSQILK